MADIDKVVKGLECCWASFPKCRGCPVCPYEKICYHDKACNELLRDALELLKSKPDIDKIVKELDDTSKQYEPRPFESINWMLRYEGIMIGLEIAQYVVKGEPIPDKF